MKILTASQIRNWDKFTIDNEPISSFDLMLRASEKWLSFFEKITKKQKKNTYLILAGLGNNGGDALNIARFLALKNNKQYTIKVWVIWHSDKFSEDFAKARYLLEKECPDIEILDVSERTTLPPIPKNVIIIDGILGTGISKPVKGWLELFFEQINNLKQKKVYAIDMPSGLNADKTTEGAVLKANTVITFQAPKLAFFMPENQFYFDEWFCIDINLHTHFPELNAIQYEIILNNSLQKFIKKRPKFSHKGTFGHSLLVGGAYGKTGAILLAGKACLRSGTGLLTIHSAKSSHLILQTALPEAMFSGDEDDKNISIISTDVLEKITAIGIGCGLGTNPITKQWLKDFLMQNYENQKPLVLDADALNIIAMSGEEMWQYIPKNTILTPHPKEFERLIQETWHNDFEKLEKLKDFAEKTQCIVILKGANTMIATPEKSIYFNTTGNPSMAKGGSGDVLTGILTALLAQKYTPLQASLLGVYWHGTAGDLGVIKKGELSLLPSDLIDFLGKAWKKL
jgi:NAD(P)H-hydrate epimerase